MKLTAHPYAQAEVYIRPKSRVLQSYSTRAAELTNEGWLAVYCLCSRTTVMHVRAFVSEFCEIPVELETLKFLLQNGYALCVETGEVKDRREVGLG